MEKDRMESLINRAQSGDLQSMEKILEVAHTSVSYQCRKMMPRQEDAEDLTQEVLLAVYQKIDTLKETKAFWSWLHRITATHCMNALSRNHVDLQFAEDEDGHSVVDDLEVLDEHSIPDKALDNAETARMIDEIVSGLPEAQRMSTLLYYYNEMSVKEIAQIMNVPENTVKSRLNLARKAIKDKVLDYEKQGVKLYSVSILPFLWYFLRTAAESQANAGAAAACASGVITTATVATTTAATTGATVTGTVTAGIAAKIVAGCLTLIVIIGGASICLSGQDATDPADELLLIETPNITMESQITEETISNPVPDKSEPAPFQTETVPDELLLIETPNTTIESQIPEKTISNPVPDKSEPARFQTETVPDELLLIETPNTTIESQIPKETISNPVPDKSESTPFQTETAPTETIHIHNYASKVTAPSCTRDGYTTFTCDCGDICTADYTSAVGHSYNEKITVATCTEMGYTTYTCSVCGNFYTGNKINSTGHSWGSWTVTKESTTTAEGQEQRICKTCDKTESRNIEKLAYENFTGSIGNYNAHNLAYTDWKGDTEQAAFIEVYTIGKSDKALSDLAAQFEKVYGFAPSLGDKYCCTTSCNEVGTYIVEGYLGPQTVYHYAITDKTYIYITNEMYKVYVQHCDDGSVWVGYCIYATMDTIGTERSKAEVQDLDWEMYATFEDLIGLNLSEMNAYEEQLELKIGNISEAGTVRSVHSDVPVQVLYIYCRGFAYGND